MYPTIASVDIFIIFLRCCYMIEASKTLKERVLKEGPWHEGGNTNSMWMKMITCIRKVALEEFGVTKRGKREAKET
jgi:hypothetical protein